MQNKKGISEMEYHQILKENVVSLVSVLITPGSKTYYTNLSHLLSTASDESSIQCNDCFIVQFQ
jgi:hypothetical protein